MKAMSHKPECPHKVEKKLTPVRISSTSKLSEHTYIHTLNYATSLAVGLTGSSQTSRVEKQNLGLISRSHST